VFFFCFASDFEKVPMEEDVGHGGMIINCWCYFELECCFCVFGKLVGKKFWRFWLHRGWIKWVVKDGLEQNAQGSIYFVFRSFFLLCRCTSPYVFFEMQCSRCSLTRKNIVSFVPLYKIRSWTCATTWNKMGTGLEVMICGERKNNIVCGRWSRFSICDTSKGGRNIML
jgi:hypothetical protein